MTIFDQVKSQLDKSGLPAFALARLAAIGKDSVQVSSKPPGMERCVSLGSTDGKSIVLMYNGAAESPRASQDLLEVYGELIIQSAGAVGAEIWEKKLTLALPETVAEFTEKLQSKKFTSYRSLVESFDGAVARLTALHLANALIWHRVSFAGAFNVNVLEWPQTASFAQGQAPYSLVPLVSAYCDPDVWKSFPVAFRHRVAGTLTCGRQDVLKAFNGVIESVCGS